MLLAYFVLSIMYMYIHIVISPVSTTVLLGEEAKFSCSGETLAIVWTINGTSIGSLGIRPSEETVNGVVTSDLTVIGSAQYDNASIQCVLVNSPTVTFLPPVSLTVLGKPQTIVCNYVPSIKILSTPMLKDVALLIL